jgi:c-di-GMP-binding flagellar brake protein YcgR
MFENQDNLYAQITGDKIEQIKNIVKKNVQIRYDIADRTLAIEGIVKKVSKYGLNVQIIFEKRTNIKRIQRREDFRLNVNLPIKYKVIVNNNGNEIGSKYITNESITVDISGGGVCFISSYELDKDDIVEVEILLPECGNLIAKGSIIRSNYSNSRGHWCNAIKFIDLEQKEKEKIISYIFKRQQILLKKG